MENENITMDAKVGVQPTRSGSQLSTLKTEQVIEIENDLDFMEKVSLIYLLYDHDEIALQYLIQILNGATLNVVVEWMNYAEKTSHWREKLLEALAIIQNFFIIEKLGYTKRDICDRFLPMNANTSLFVELYKKKLYRICETLTNMQMETFLNHVRNDFSYKKLHFKEFLLPHIEMYFLYWHSIKYITATDFTNISKAFKVMEMYDIADSLKRVCIKGDSYAAHTKEKLVPSTNALIQPVPVLCSDYKSERYYIDSENPGICLIINQEVFYREPDPRWANVLSSIKMQLTDREGTNIDRDYLKQTFEMFGYTVIVKENLTHIEIIENIITTLKMIQNQSSFILCILSHGLEGMVYGANSIPVSIKIIRKTICSTNTKHLKTKPKVLILQACQGTECQLVSDDEDDVDIPAAHLDKQPTINADDQNRSSQYENDNCNLELDGPSRPKTADVLLFWATVPGYGAVRHVSHGSWFIQSLCSKIQEKANEMHFEDICTMVKQEVIDKRWKTTNSTRVMVPNKESTLSRFFFLPSRKSS